MKHVYRVLRTRLIIFLLSLLLIALLLVAGGRFSLLSSLQQELSAGLPPRVAAALVNAHDENAALQHISKQLVQGLQLSSASVTALPFFAGPQLLDVELQQVSRVDGSNNRGLIDGPLYVSWPYGQGLIQARLDLAFPVLWYRVLAAALLISLLLQWLLEFLPGSRRALTGAWRAHFRQQGYGPEEAAHLAAGVSSDPAALDWAQRLARDCGQGALPLPVCIDLAGHAHWRGFSEVELGWFRLALLQGLSPEHAARIAVHPPTLVFDLHSHTLRVHGLAIPMAKTPLFYYFWYARRQVLQLGAYVNPSPSRPNKEAGQWLADLMEAFGGHAKAINDLREYGLKGKTLDQNRNKIKDDLTRALGDLAAPFLFQAERDLATARYRYELLLAPEDISLDQEPTFRDISESTETSYSPLRNMPA